MKDLIPLGLLISTKSSLVFPITYPELAKKTTHIGHGMLTLSTGKMSSRTGKVIAAEDLLNDIAQLVKDKLKDEGDDKTADIIAVAAIKYSILKQVVGKDIIFDKEQSISFEGDSGPYLQYSYVDISFRWASGCDILEIFQDITSMGDDLGIFTKNMLKIYNILTDLKSIATNLNKLEIMEKLDEACTNILRDIVNTFSLHLID